MPGLRPRDALPEMGCLSKFQVQPVKTPHHLLQHVCSVQCVQAELLAEEAAERNKAEAKAAEKAAKKQAKAAKGESDKRCMCIWMSACACWLLKGCMCTLFWCQHLLECCEWRAACWNGPAEPQICWPLGCCMEALTPNGA